MRHDFWVTVAVAFSLLVVASGTVMVVSAGATPTATPTPPDEIVPSDVVDDDGDREVLEHVDDDVRLINWSYQNGTFVLVFEVDSPKKITISEAVQMEEGTGKGSIREPMLDRGTQTVSIDVPRRAGQAGVVMTTDQSVSQGHYSWISTGQTEPDRPAVEWGTVQWVILLAVCCTGYITHRTTLKWLNDGEVEVTRVK